MINSIEPVIPAKKHLSTLQQKRQLRLQMRQARRKLSKRQHQNAAIRLKRQLNQHPAFKFSKRIALYLPNDGEVETLLVIKQAWQEGKKYTCQY